MNIYLNKITGIDDALVSLIISTGNWTREKEENIRNLCERVLDTNGKIRTDASEEDLNEYNEKMDKLVKWGRQHITLLRFIDFDVTVDGLHRAGQDDWDSHAKRYDNRILRLSTRVKAMDTKLSDFYVGKVLTTDESLKILGIDIPESFEYDGKKFIKCQNGYIAQEYAKSPDVRRGLYMLGLSSTFVFKVNLTEWSHVYKERNKDGHANPEVKELCEGIADRLADYQPKFTRELFKEILN
jgi:thymidylate synthase ThyX